VPRLFVALYPPPEVAAALLKELAALRLPNIRPTPVEQLHLTLQFIGDTDPRELDDVCESVERSTSGLAPASIGVTGLISLPERHAPRLVAAELEAHPTLLELHRRLALRLARNAKERSRDRFLPHMTLGRFTSAGGPRVQKVLDAQSLKFDFTEAVLVESVLHPKGAEHRPLFKYALVG
jgi:2'-5' RNA ligase